MNDFYDGLSTAGASEYASVQWNDVKVGKMLQNYENVKQYMM